MEQIQHNQVNLHNDCKMRGGEREKRKSRSKRNGRTPLWFGSLRWDGLMNQEIYAVIGAVNEAKTIIKHHPYHLDLFLT